MTTSDIKADEYFRSSTTTETYEPFIVNGTAVGEVHWIRQTAVGGNTLLAGLWRAEPLTTPYFFGEDEVIHALEGELEIVLETGESVTLTAGDIASFSKGTNSVWTVKSSFKKLFVISG